MDQQTTGNDKKSFLRNDYRLVCGMLLVYGVCILGLIAATLWGLDRRSKRISANATSTANAVATQRANITATAGARATKQAQYSVMDPFDDNSRDWLVDTVNDEYMVGSIAIDSGLYAWNVYEVKQPFYYWVAYPGESSIKDFDTYVDFKITGGSPDSVCSGFVFRIASSGWEQGAYLFSVCNNSYFYSNYYNQGKWEPISDWKYTDAFSKYDWNRLEISARGDHFTFILNNETFSEMTDDRQPTGGLALLIEINEETPSTVWFDNFGFQPR